MATDREIALEQALVVVLGAAKRRGLDGEDLVNHATALLLGGNPLRYVDHPYVSMAVKEISDAHAKALSTPS